LNVGRPQDTVTGFLLTGVGNVDSRKKKNFLVVDGSARLSLCGTAVGRPPRGHCLAVRAAVRAGGA